jgi:hypothetical protein
VAHQFCSEAIGEQEQNEKELSKIKNSKSCCKFYMQKTVITDNDKNAYKNETHRPRLANKRKIFGIPQ